MYLFRDRRDGIDTSRRGLRYTRRSLKASSSIRDSSSCLVMNRRKIFDLNTKVLNLRSREFTKVSNVDWPRFSIDH